MVLNCPQALLAYPVFALAIVARLVPNASWIASVRTQEHDVGKLDWRWEFYLLALLVFALGAQMLDRNIDAFNRSARKLGQNLEHFAGLSLIFSCHDFNRVAFFDAHSSKELRAPMK